MGAIRHLAASYEGTILATAEFESMVHVWDLESLTKVSEFKTTLDFGGHRLAISPDGKTVAAGAWARHGIAAYRSDNGRELWRRKDLKRVQYLNFDRTGQQLWCSFDEIACHSLQIENGKTLQVVRDAEKLWISPLGSTRLLQRPYDFALVNENGQIAYIPKASFAALSVAFSETEVCISESDGPVRSFSLYSAKQIWRCDPPKGVHFLEVGFSSILGKFAGVSWPFEKGGPSILHQFDGKSGRATSLCEVDCPDSVFCQKGSHLVTRNGSVLDIQSGKIEGRLAFPMKDI